MATLTLEYQRPPSVSKLLIIIVLIIIAIMFAAVIYGPHAAARHGGLAVEIRDCVSRGGTMETWMNPDTGRQANICQLANGMFGVQICKGNNEITCIPKEKMSKLEQVYQYLKNRGYKFVSNGG